MLNIEDFLWRNFDAVFAFRNPPTDWRVDCPFCPDRVGKHDTKAHLHIGIDNRVVHCFRCDYTASWIKFVMDFQGVGYARALSELYTVPSPANFEKVRSEFLPVVTPDQRQCASKELILPDGYIPLTSKDFLARMARIYMKRRGFSRQICEKYRLGVSHDLGLRVIIPIEANYWQARALFPFIQPRYTGPADVNSRALLFNAKALDLYDEVVVCEGPISAMAVGDNAIALVGKNPTKEKIKRLLASPVKHFIITIESEAELSMLRLSDALASYDRRVTVWRYDGDDDPASTSVHSVQPYDLKTKLTILLSS